MKKRGFSPAIVVPIILGIIVIFSVGAVLYTQGGNIAKRIFGEDVMIPGPAEEEKFTPYESTLTEDEQSIINSMNALSCAINIVASDKFDTSVCKQYEKREEVQGIEAAKPEEKKEEKPEEKKEEPPVPAPTGGAVASSLAGKWEMKTAEFGEVTVECGQKYSLGNDGPYTLDDIGKFVEDCAMRSNLADEDTYCGKIFLRPITDPGFVYTEDSVRDWLKANAGTAVKNAIEKEDLDIDFELPSYINTAFNVYVCADDDFRIGATDRQVRLYINPDYDSDCFSEYKKWQKAAEYSVVTNESQFCVVKNFQFPQKITWEGSWNPLTWVAGYNDPMYIAYYEAFPEGMDKFWHVDGISIVTVSLIIGTAAFDLVPLVGKGMKAAFGAALKKGAKETAEQATKQTVKTGLSGFLESIMKQGVKKTVQREVVTESLENLGGGVSKKVATEAADIADNRIVGFFKRIRMKISPKYRKELVEELAKDMRKLDLASQPIDAAFYTSRLDDAAKRLGRNPDDLFDAESYLAELVEETDAAQRFILESTLPRPVKELEADAALFRKIHQEILEEYHEKLARDLAEASFDGFTQKLTRAQIKKATEMIAVKNFMKGMFGESFERMSKEQIKENMELAFSKFSKLSLSEQKRAVKKAAELSKELIDPDGFIDFSKIAGRPITDEAVKKQLTQDFMDVVASTEGMAITDAMTKAGWTAASGLKTGTVGPGRVSWVFDLVPVQRVGRIAKSAFVRPDTLINKVPFLRGVTWIGRVPVTTVGELAEWVKNHKYAVIALIALYGSSEDAANEKFVSVGPNSLGVDMPYIYTDPVPWNLINETKPYYIAPIDQGGNLRNERLYLVSPCRANLIVTKGLCECHRMPTGIQHYRFNDENFPMDVRGVTIRMDNFKDDDFVFDHFNKIHEWDIDKLTEQEKKERLKSTIKFMTDIGKENEYLFIRNSFLRDYIPGDFNQITDLKQAYIARERMRIVDFFDEKIAGFSGEKQFYHVGEEAGTVQESYRAWEELEPFYDLEGVQKECIGRDGWTNAMSWVMVGFADVEDNPLKHPAYKSSCVTVQVQRIAGDDANYCIDEYPYVETLRYGAIGVQVALSVGITFLTGGAAAPVTTALLLATTSVGAGALEEIIARRAKWPAYNREGIPPNAKVPIAEKIT